jgi:hypothetical protein
MSQTKSTIWYHASLEDVALTQHHDNKILKDEERPIRRIEPKTNSEKKKKKKKKKRSKQTDIIYRQHDKHVEMGIATSARLLGRTKKRGSMFEEKKAKKRQKTKKKNCIRKAINVREHQFTFRTINRREAKTNFRSRKDNKKKLWKNEQKPLFNR